MNVESHDSHAVGESENPATKKVRFKKVDELQMEAEEPTAEEIDEAFIPDFDKAMDLKRNESAGLDDIQWNSHTHLNQEQLEKVKVLYQKYAHLFAEGHLKETWKIKGTRHYIETGNQPPTRVRRATPLKDRKIVRETVDELKENNLIRPSTSPWCSPCLVVQKDGRKPRVCVDYRKLNALTCPDSYTSPTPNELLDCLTGSEYFSSMDAMRGFWQVPIAEADQEKTAFSTPDGLFEWLRMPFGLRNAPATFQRAMDEALGSLRFEECLCYVDDILVFSKTFDEHLERLENVFNALTAAGVHLKGAKCTFAVQKLDFLGHQVSKEGVTPRPQLIKSFSDFPVPKDALNVKKFLGLGGYYRKFVPEFAKIARPLQDLTKKDHKFEWTNDCERAFIELKRLLENAPILKLPDETMPFTLMVDTGEKSLGASLMQSHNETLLPVCFASWGLRGAQLNYSMPEKEMLALVMAVKHWHHYIGTKKFTVLMDAKGITDFLRKDASTLRGRLARWRCYLTQFDFQVQHVARDKNVPADALTFTPVWEEGAAEASNGCKNTDEDIFEEWEMEDDERIFDQLDLYDSYSFTPMFVSKASKQSPVAKEKELVIPVQQKAAPAKKQLSSWAILQRMDPTINQIVQYLQKEKLPSESEKRKMPNSNIINWSKTMFVNGDGELWKKEGINKMPVAYVPKLADSHPYAKLRYQCLKAYHTVAHFCKSKLKASLQKHFWWPYLEDDIVSFIRGCHYCCWVKHYKSNPKLPHLPQISPRVRTKVIIDGAGPLNSVRGYQYVLVIQEATTRMLWTFPLNYLRQMKLMLPY